MLSDKGSERAVLAGICKHGAEGYFEISDIMSVDVFTDTKNQLIFRCLEHLFIRDVTTIDIPGIYSAANSLKYEDQICKKQEDEQFIRSLFNFPIELENIRKYAIKLINLKIAREAKTRLHEAASKVEHLTGEEDTYKILELVEAPYHGIMNSLTTTEDSGDIGEDIEDYVKNRLENPVTNIGLPTQFPLFNAIVGDGLRTGVHLIAARLKQGKSTFGKEIGLHVSKNLNIPVLYIDTEMQADEQRDRLLASVSEIELRKIERGLLSKQEQDKLLYAAKELKDVPFTHKRVSGMQFSEILSIMRRWINHRVGYNEDGETNPHLVVYDYFKLMNTSELNNLKEYEAMGFQISSLHDFCANFRTPILSFVQTNRDGVSKESTDVIAQSDRLGWNCISLSIWKRKTPEEKGQEGVKNGTHKLVPLEGRFMQKLEPGDHINFYFDEAKSKITELGLKSQSPNEPTDS